MIKKLIVDVLTCKKIAVRGPKK
jgi:hypothetical protein